MERPIIIFTERNKLPENIKYYLDDCEAFFDAKVSSKEFTDKDLDIIKKIDNAVLLDKDIGTVRTPFGVASIENLSSGCKTVLVLQYLIRNSNDYSGKILLDVTACGYNALDILFNLVSSAHIDIVLLLRHDNGLCRCSSHNYVVDGIEETELM